MNWPDQHFLLNTTRLPYRLSMDDAGLLLGFLPHEMGILWREGLLKTALLGKPAPNGHKYFSTKQLEHLGKDHEWLNKATRTVQQSWQSKNRKNPTKFADSEEVAPPDY